MILITQDKTDKEILSIKQTDKNEINLLMQNNSELLVDCDEDSYILFTESGNFQSLKETKNRSQLFINSNLIPAIAIDENKNILMQAFINNEALYLSYESGFAHYFTRKKLKIWKKGKDSGHTQKIKKIKMIEEPAFVIYSVEQNIGACHTGYYSCFYRKPLNGSYEFVYESKAFDPKKIYNGTA